MLGVGHPDKFFSQNGIRLIDLAFVVISASAGWGKGEDSQTLSNHVGFLLEGQGCPIPIGVSGDKGRRDHDSGKLGLVDVDDVQVVGLGEDETVEVLQQSAQGSTGSVLQCILERGAEFTGDKDGGASSASAFANEHEFGDRLCSGNVDLGGLIFQRLLKDDLGDRCRGCIGHLWALIGIAACMFLVDVGMGSEPAINVIVLDVAQTAKKV